MCSQELCWQEIVKQRGEEKKIQQSGGQIFSKEEVGRKTLLYKKPSTNKVEKLAFVLPFSP